MAPKFSRSYGKFQSHTGQKNLVKWVKLRVFGHFLENAWGKGLKYRMLMYPDHLIKSPRYTGGDFIFLYRFVRRRRRRPQILVHAITFEQLFRFLSFFDDCWPWPTDYLIRFGSILVVTLTLNFQSQIWNLLYLSKKGSDCHETKSKHIDWTLGLKCDHQIWPWPSPWPWIFKVKYGICYISTKSGPIATKRKAKYRLNSRPQMWPMGLTLTMTLTFEFSRSNVILTIWWPRSGVRIYQIGTGVTSDVGVPSTHLVRFWSRSVDFTNFGGILTQWNISNMWFPYLMENAWQLWPEIWHADVSWLPLELLRFGHGLLIFLILAGFWPSENKITHKKEGKQ